MLNMSIKCKIKSIIRDSKDPLPNRGGMVHVFVLNRHGTDLSVRCMSPYDKYRQFTPNPEGGVTAVQRCLTAIRRTVNAMSCALENKAPRQ